MRTVGAVLKNTRTSKGLSLAQVEEATKIKTRILEKIESDEIGKFGSFGHALGLVKNYGEFLGLNSEYLAALFRRQVGFPKIKPKTTFTFPKIFLIARLHFFVVLVLLAIFAYLTFQLANLKTGPKLEIFEPEQGAVFSLSNIQVSGITDSEAQVVINGQKVPTNLAGEFSVQFELTPGVNLIEIVVKKGTGGERKVVRTVELIE